MAFSLALRQVGDYFLLDWNEVPGTPKAGWTPVVGNLVQREGAQDNEFDVLADTEVPAGIVISTNGATGTIGVAEFTPGTTAILPIDTLVGLVVGVDSVIASAGGMKVVGTANFNRTQVKRANAGVGAGLVIDSSPFGASGTGTEDTVTVRF